MTKYIKLTVNVPLTHADVVREAIGRAASGKLGSYGFCSFSTRGVGRGLPIAGAHPTIGTIGHMEMIDEEKIETLCEEAELIELIKAIKAVHPYEKPVIIHYPVEVV